MTPAAARPPLSFGRRACAGILPSDGSLTGHLPRRRAPFFFRRGVFQARAWPLGRAAGRAPMGACRR
eukprot:2530013-Lingulodinium_polyedra.AAC.1